MKNEDKLQALIMMYNEHANQARQHENLRQQMTGIIMVIAVALIGYIFDQVSSDDTRVLLLGGIGLMLLGGYGFLFSFKHYERNRLHVSILRKFRNQIDHLFDDKKFSLQKIRDKGRKKHELIFGSHFKLFIRKRRAYRLWNNLHLGVTIIGCIVLISYFII